MHKYSDVTGKRFGNLVAIKELRRGGKSRGVVWLWRCDCGKEIERVSSDIKRGHQRSCGCMKAINLRKRASKKPGVAALNTLYYQYKNGAKHRGLDFKISKKRFKEITKQNCYFCGKEPLTEFKRQTMNGSYIYNGIDRLDNKKGYINGNIVPCCPRCNMSKLRLSESSFLEMVKAVYLHRFSNESR